MSQYNDEDLIYKSDNKEFEPAPFGHHNAVIVDVLDVGWGSNDKYNFEEKKGRPFKKFIRLVLQIDKYNSENKRYGVYIKYNLQLGRSSNGQCSALHTALESIIGRGLTDYDLKEFNLKDLIGLNAQILIKEAPYQGKMITQYTFSPPHPSVPQMLPEDYVRKVKRDGYKRPEYSIFEPEPSLSLWGRLPRDFADKFPSVRGTNVLQQNRDANAAQQNGSEYVSPFKQQFNNAAGEATSNAFKQAAASVAPTTQVAPSPAAVAASKANDGEHDPFADE